MNKEDFELNVWYPITDETYWVEDCPDEFPDCQTIICCTDKDLDDTIRTRRTAYMGWGTMAKDENYMFMIIKKPFK